MASSTSGVSRGQPDGRTSRPHMRSRESLKACGFRWGRLKTGTPPRLHRRSIDFSVFDRQEGDRPPIPFSFTTDAIDREQIACYPLHTTARVHELVRGHIARVPAVQRADSWDWSEVLPVARRQGHAIPGSRSTSPLSGAGGSGRRRNVPERLLDEPPCFGAARTGSSAPRARVCGDDPAGLRCRVPISFSPRSSIPRSRPIASPVSSWRAKSTGRRVTKKPRHRGSWPASTRRGRSRAMGRCCSTAARATSARSSTI